MLDIGSRLWFELWAIYGVTGSPVILALIIRLFHLGGVRP